MTDEWKKDFHNRFVCNETWEKDANNSPIIERTLWDWEEDNPLIDAQKVEDFISNLLDQATSKAREEELDKIIDAVKKSYETQRDFNGDIESRGIAYGWNNCLDFIQSLIQKDK